MLSIVLVVKCIVDGRFGCLFFVDIVLFLELGIYEEVNMLINVD